MNKYTLRPLTLADAQEAAALWHTVFGDDEALVLEFFRLFAHGSLFGVCAESSGKIAAAAYCPPGTDRIAPDGTAEQGAYLYAVATHPDHRKQGLAKAICRQLRDDAFRRGMAHVFTRPSEESLYPWYEEKIGALPLLGGRTAAYTRTCDGTLPVTPLTAEEYAHARSRILQGQPHVSHSMEWLTWEQLLHGAYGGGFYAVGDHIATLYRDGSALQIGEFLPAPTEDAIQSLLTALSADSCTCILHGSEHYVSAVSCRPDAITDNPWFGPCYG